MCVCVCVVLFQVGLTPTSRLSNNSSFVQMSCFCDLLCAGQPVPCCSPAPVVCVCGGGGHVYSSHSSAVTVPVLWTLRLCGCVIILTEETVQSGGLSREQTWRSTLPWLSSFVAGSSYEHCGCRHEPREMLSPLWINRVDIG